LKEEENIFVFKTHKATHSVVVFYNVVNCGRRMGSRFLMRSWPQDLLLGVAQLDRLVGAGSAFGHDQVPD
jgi:hypothetical protein